MRDHMTRAAGEGGLRAPHVASRPLQPEGHEDNRAPGKHDGRASALATVREAVASFLRRCATCP